MDNSEFMENLPGIKETVKLRIELLFKKSGKRLPFEKEFLDSPIQGVPFRCYVRITNISNVICEGGRIQEALFFSNACSMGTSSESDIQFGSLNPKDSHTLELDAFTLKLEGAFWFSCNVIPLSDDQEFLTFQYDSSHQRDNQHREMNTFGVSVFIEGKLASLQAKTNKYILILTVITVLEAVFGIKNIIQTTALGLGGLLAGLANLLLKVAAAG